MATIQWATPVNGFFQDDLRWTGGETPGPSDTAVLGALGGAHYTVVSRSGVLGLALGGTQTVGSLQTASNAELEVTGDVDALDLLAGDTTFHVNNGVVNAGTIVVQNAVLAIKVLGVDHLLGATADLNVGGAIDNTGTIRLNGQPHLLGLADADQRTYLSIHGTTTLTGGGEVTLSNDNLNVVRGSGAAADLANVDNTISGAGYFGAKTLTFHNQAQGVVDANQSEGLVIHTKGVLDNAGMLEASGKGVMVIAATTVDQSSGGVIRAFSGARIDFETAHIEGGTLQSSGTGVLVSNDRGSVIDGTKDDVTIIGVLRVANGTAITLQGAIDNTGTIGINADVLGPNLTDLRIGAGGATLSGGGKVVLSGLADDRLYGVSSDDTLTNVDNHISGGGLLGAGHLTLVNDSKGVITGTSTVALLIDTGSGGLSNAGSIGASGIGSTTIQGDVANSGVLFAAGGALTVNGTVTGVGRAAINGGTIDFAAGFAENVSFNGSAGRLELGQSVGYTGVVSGFSHTGGTSFDLDDIAFTKSTTASYSGNKNSGVLTVTDGVHIAHIKLTGDYTSAAFNVSSDGHGGTVVVDPTAKRSTSGHAFVSAMAGLGASPGSASHIEAHHGPDLRLLVRPAAHFA